jgi:hypothetical protein
VSERHCLCSIGLLVLLPSATFHPRYEKGKRLSAENQNESLCGRRLCVICWLFVHLPNSGGVWREDRAPTLSLHPSRPSLLLLSLDPWRRINIQNQRLFNNRVQIERIVSPKRNKRWNGRGGPPPASG